MITLQRFTPGIFALCVLFLTAVAVVAEQKTAPPPDPPPAFGLTAAKMWNWSSEQWTGDNEPYRAARLAIEQSDPATLLPNYRLQAWAHPKDPLAVFQWGYAAYRLMRQYDDPAKRREIMSHVFDALWEAPSPHTYDYARLRFCVAVNYLSLPGGVPLGERLMAQDRNDYMVGYPLGTLYMNAYPAQPRKALLLFSDLKRTHPDKAGLYASIGEAYLLEYYASPSPHLARAVAANYQKYLDLAPANAGFRKRAQQLVEQFSHGRQK